MSSPEEINQNVFISSTALFIKVLLANFLYCVRFSSQQFIKPSLYINKHSVSYWISGSVKSFHFFPFFLILREVIISKYFLFNLLGISNDIFQIISLAILHKAQLLASSTSHSVSSIYF